MGMDPFPDLGVKKFIALLDGKEKSYVTVKALPFSHDFFHFSSYKSNIVWTELLFWFCLLELNQVISHGEQVFLRVREKCCLKPWFANEDINSLEELIGRLKRLKENVGFIVNRVTAIQAGLDSWQSEQINRELYYLSFLSIIFLPLSIITGVFGMNVGGVPWTGQNNPELKDGFRNVILICVVMLLFVLLCFLFPAMYTRIAAWRRQNVLGRSWSINRKSILRRPLHVGDQGRGGYLRI